MSSSAAVVERRTQFERIQDARRNTDALFGIVRAESLYERPIPERHRIIFYIGHLEAFDWNLLKSKASERFAAASESSPELDKLFAFGIDPVDGGLPNDQPSDWPKLEAVWNYVADRRRAVDALLHEAQSRDRNGAQDSSLDTLLHVAIEHRLMHAETLAYMFHQLPYAAKRAGAQSEMPTAGNSSRSAGRDHVLSVPAGVATLGLRASEGSFGWDNEFEAFDISVPAFQIDKYKVSNDQFLEFLLAGGYQNDKLWRPEDWQWREQEQITQPVFWSRYGAEWRYRGMFEEIRLPLDWPVYVSYAEASAYANWRNKALPSEAQWHRAAFGTLDNRQRSYAWGEQPPANLPGNFDFRRWDPEAVNAHQDANRTAFGAVGMLGNGWEWTSTLFGPFPGFQPFAFYPGYSANFFDGKHFVMKGGSARTAAALLRHSFRNWFQPHYQYMYAGFRCTNRPSD
jgi:ergothioneine biosynthesis protein EgtB